jgi:hypothetical protein
MHASFRSIFSSEVLYCVVLVCLVVTDEEDDDADNLFSPEERIAEDVMSCLFCFLGVSFTPLKSFDGNAGGQECLFFIVWGKRWLGSKNSRESIGNIKKMITDVRGSMKYCAFTYVLPQ